MPRKHPRNEICHHCKVTWGFNNEMLVECDFRMGNAKPDDRRKQKRKPLKPSPKRKKRKGNPP